MTASVKLCGVLLLLAGCSLPQRRVELIELPSGGNVVSYPADLRGAYVVNGRTCAEPVPDVALASTSDLTATIKALTETGQSVEATAAANLAAKAVELSGRTQLVVLARDVLFRLCEMGVDQQTSVALFDRVLDMIERLARADETDANATLLRETAALKRANDAVNEVFGR